MKKTIDELWELTSDKEFCIYHKIVDNTRWDVVYEGVFKFDNKYWMGDWRMAATENQETDWNDIVDLIEVEPVEEKVIVYKSINK